MALFESYERRIDTINRVLNSYGISSIEEAKKLVDDLGVDVYNIVKGIQPICFENACKRFAKYKSPASCFLFLPARYRQPKAFPSDLFF